MKTILRSMTGAVVATGILLATGAVASADATENGHNCHGAGASKSAPGWSARPHVEQAFTDGVSPATYTGQSWRNTTDDNLTQYANCGDNR